MPDTHRTTRRRFVRLGGLSAVAAFGGCLSSQGSDAEAETATAPTLRLGRVSYMNLSEFDHDLEIVVSVDDDVVHWETHAVAANTGNAEEEAISESLALELPSEPVPFTVMVRLDGERTARIADTDGLSRTNDGVPEKDRPCTHVRIQITEPAELTVENWEAAAALCD